MHQPAPQLPALAPPRRATLPHTSPGLSDARFRRLVGEEAWQTLPPHVRHRFSKRLGPADIALYRGRVIETRLSRCGRLLAALLRVVGAPLPLHDGATGPAVVAVTEDAGAGGQMWTRTYARPGRFPQVIHSTKRFGGPTGLEEYIGHGIGMTLTVGAEDGALVFRSQGYFLQLPIGRHVRRVPLPRWLTPGATTVTHRHEDDATGAFSFTLSLDHPWLGRMVHQTGIFCDVVDAHD